MYTPFKCNNILYSHMKCICNFYATLEYMVVILFIWYVWCKVLPVSWNNYFLYWTQHCHNTSHRLYMKHFQQLDGITSLQILDLLQFMMYQFQNWQVSFIALRICCAISGTPTIYFTWEKIVGPVWRINLASRSITCQRNTQNNENLTKSYDKAI